MPEQPAARTPVPSSMQRMLPGAPHRDSATCLAFDFGMQRIGVAVGESSLQTAHPLKQIRAEPFKAAMAAIAALIKEWQPAVLIVGVPSDAEGAAQTSATARRIERFVRQLQAAFSLPVERVDERYSSIEAEGRIRAAAGARRAAQAARGRELDSHAAQIILEQYFSERRR